MPETFQFTALEQVDRRGKRTVIMGINLPVMPYVRQTRYSRWANTKLGERATQYNESRATLRDAIALVMSIKGIKPFGKVKLGFASSFWSPQAGRADLGNLEKALEDACNGILYPDDRWIWKRGEGGQEKGEARFQLTVWEV